MVHPYSCSEPAQSRFGTPRGSDNAGDAHARRGIVANMASTSLLAMSAALLAGASEAPSNQSPRVTVVATARATIVSGIRMPTDRPLSAAPDGERRITLPKPRETRCPERPDDLSCRLIVTDLP